MRPKLTFFCELDEDALADLFADPAVIDGLRALDARVGLGLVDLSDARARIVKRLESSGIPVVAWLLMPKSDGYWFSSSNYREAASRWDDVQAWTKAHGLTWDAVGFDAEFDIRELERMAEDRRNVRRFLLRRLGARSEIDAARRAYEALYADIVAAGYAVEHYYLPPIVDEIEMGSKILQQLTGVVDVPGDRHIPMLYTSFVRRMGGPGTLWSYGRGAQAVAVGSTGGGVTVGGVDELAPLDWDELTRDLRLARRICDDISIFSLEGCVRQGFLDRLADFDWAGPVEIPYAEAVRVERFRRRLRAVLWVDAHPRIVLATLVAGAILLARRRRARA